MAQNFELSNGERIEQIDRQIERLLGKVAMGSALPDDYNMIEKLGAERNNLLQDSRVDMRMRA